VIAQGASALMASRRGHQDELVPERTLGHCPHHRQFALGFHPGDLLRVQGRSSPSTPVVFLAATLVITDTSSRMVAMSSRAGRAGWLLPP